MEDLSDKSAPEGSVVELEGADGSTSRKMVAEDSMRHEVVFARTEEEIFSNALSATVSMACPPEKVGPLIGKKGVVVQQIMRRSSCRIYVDQNFPEGHARQIQLTGHPKDLSIAIALVALVMEHGPSIISPVQYPLRDSPREVSTENADSDFICPAAKVGALIGPKGSNVHEIFRRTGCRVQVIQEGVPNGADRRVSFFGTVQQIADAKALVSLLINGGSIFDTSNVPFVGNGAPAGAAVTLGSKIQESDVDPEKVRLVIGAKGVTIGEIMRRSGCKIFINQNFPEGQPHKVVFTGTPQQIDVAKYLVDTVVFSGMSALYSILNGCESVVIQEIAIFQAQAHRLQASDAINDIQNRFSVKVNCDAPTVTSTFPEGTCRVSILGKLESVHNAVKLVYQLCGPLPAAASGADSTVTGHFGGPPVLSSPAPILALGKDGTAGFLESAVTLSDGAFQQLAEIKNEVMGRVVGARSTNISLIKVKSGATVQVLKSDNVKGTTRVVFTGSSQNVALAAQMVQEVLVNGPAKLMKMSDAAAPAASKGLLLAHMDGEYFPHQYYGQAPAMQMYANSPQPTNYSVYPVGGSPLR